MLSKDGPQQIGLGQTKASCWQLTPMWMAAVCSLNHHLLPLEVGTSRKLGMEVESGITQGSWFILQASQQELQLLC